MRREDSFRSVRRASSSERALGGVIHKGGSQAPRPAGPTSREARAGRRMTRMPTVVQKGLRLRRRLGRTQGQASAVLTANIHLHGSPRGRKPTRLDQPPPGAPHEMDDFVGTRLGRAPAVDPARRLALCQPAPTRFACGARNHHLPLLPSGPDGVRSASPRRARLSSPLGESNPCGAWTSSRNSAPL